MRIWCSKSLWHPRDQRRELLGRRRGGNGKVSKVCSSLDGFAGGCLQARLDVWVFTEMASFNSSAKKEHEDN